MCVCVLCALPLARLCLFAVICGSADIIHFLSSKFLSRQLFVTKYVHRHNDNLTLDKVGLQLYMVVICRYIVFSRLWDSIYARQREWHKTQQTNNHSHITKFTECWISAQFVHNEPYHQIVMTSELCVTLFYCLLTGGVCVLERVCEISNYFDVAWISKTNLTFNLLIIWFIMVCSSFVCIGSTRMNLVTIWISVLLRFSQTLPTWYYNV